MIKKASSDIVIFELELHKIVGDFHINKKFWIEKSGVYIDGEEFVDFIVKLYEDGHMRITRKRDNAEMRFSKFSKSNYVDMYVGEDNYQIEYSYYESLVAAIKLFITKWWHYQWNSQLGGIDLPMWEHWFVKDKRLYIDDKHLLNYIVLDVHNLSNFKAIKTKVEDEEVLCGTVMCSNKRYMKEFNFFTKDGLGIYWSDIRYPNLHMLNKVISFILT